MAKSASLSFEINNTTSEDVPRGVFAHIASSFSQILKPDDKFVVSVGLVSAAKIKTLNQTYRGKNKPTNVISIIYADEQSAKVENYPLGEVILCPAVLKKEARSQKISYREHFKKMLIHGIIHLFDIDHERSKSEAKQSFNLEQMLMDM